MLAQLLLCASLVPAPQGPWKEAVPSSGRADPRLTPLDELMRKFVRDNELPGAALAVSRAGRLIYSRGFGYANVDAGKEMEPDAIFRIASLSKPITSATVLLLVQQGELDLDDPVLLHLDPALMQGQLPRDVRWADLTIRQLLQHRGGFDRELSGDPMFTSVRPSWEANEAQRRVILHMFERKLDHDPGTHYAYSNFGYCLLGRVIERSTGEGYETAVRRLLLEPLGVSTMRIGSKLKRERGEREVTYYTGHEPQVRRLDPGEPHTAAAYGEWNHGALDSVGGWISSAPDLLRFLHLFDGPEERQLLEPKSIELLLARPPAGTTENETTQRWYGLGWLVFQPDNGPPNIWHNGSLPGTETLLVRRGDSLSWALLFNARYDQEGEVLIAQIDALVHKAVREVRVWPDFDLFNDSR
jgi:N-acyl-D-amino-acid deacylase